MISQIFRCYLKNITSQTSQHSAGAVLKMPVFLIKWHLRRRQKKGVPLWTEQKRSIKNKCGMDSPAGHGWGCVRTCSRCSGPWLAMPRRFPVTSSVPDWIFLSTVVPPRSHSHLSPSRQRTEAWRIDVNTCALTHTRTHTRACNLAPRPVFSRPKPTEKGSRNGESRKNVRDCTVILGALCGYYS